MHRTVLPDKKCAHSYTFYLAQERSVTKTTCFCGLQERTYMNPVEPHSKTKDQNDIDRFNALAERWWDENGPMKALHLFTPIRLEYILKAIRNRGLSPKDSPPQTNTTPKLLSGLKILDIGCGGGLLTEPLTRLGGALTGIDASSGAVAAATAHAKAEELIIDYRCLASEELAAKPNYHGYFDVIYASEVIEHVSDIHSFASSIAQMLSPNGVVVITTINRTIPALLFAKFAAEYVLNLIPAGTHKFGKFVRPTELRSVFRASGILIDDVTGFVPSLKGGFSMSPLISVNYGAYGSFI